EHTLHRLHQICHLFRTRTDTFWDFKKRGGKRVVTHRTHTHLRHPTEGMPPTACFVEHTHRHTHTHTHTFDSVLVKTPFQHNTRKYEIIHLVYAKSNDDVRLLMNDLCLPAWIAKVSLHLL